ncbi:hypothetical protein, partial [Thiolapillus sp.]
AINRLQCIDRIETMKGRSKKLRMARDRLQSRVKHLQEQLAESSLSDANRIALEIKAMNLAVQRLETSLEAI